MKKTMTRHAFSVSLTIFLIITFSVSSVHAQIGTVETDQPIASKRPNFVIILTDDQGYGDLSCFGSKDVQTPRIDQMAAEGTKLTSFYMAAPYCTSSRAALLTGCYPKRIGMAGGVFLAADKRGLNPQEITIAEVLRSAGYRTGMFGKWHLGDQPVFLPTRQGFDHFFGLPYSHDIEPHNPKRKFPPLPLLEGEEVVELGPNADHLTKRFTERAVEFIEQSKDEPFFLYVPYATPHRPCHMAEAFMKDIPEAARRELEKEKATGKSDYLTRDKLYFHCVKEIDWSVGEILDALERAGVADNTFVIFTSDNGPARPPIGIGTAAPCRGSKGMTWDGGTRAPTIVRWPTGIVAGSKNDEVMSAIDLLPTFAKLGGAELDTDRVIDGKDILPVLQDKASSPHEAIYYYRTSQLCAVRSGKWKYHLGKGGRRDGSTVKALYDLDSDIGETTNVINDNPEVVKRLQRLAKDFQQDVAKNKRPAGSVKNPKPLTMIKNLAK